MKKIIKVMTVILLMAMSFCMVHAEDVATGDSDRKVIDETNLSEGMKEFIKDWYGSSYETDADGNPIQQKYYYDDFTYLNLINPTKEDIEAIKLFENITSINLEGVSDKITELNFENEKLDLVSVRLWDATTGKITTKGSTINVYAKALTSLTINGDALVNVSIETPKLTQLKLSNPSGVNTFSYNNEVAESVDFTEYKNVRNVYLNVPKVKTVKLPNDIVQLFLTGGKNLKKIDVSNLKKVEALDVRGAFASIDVSKNKELHELSVISAKLNKLNVSKLSKLEYLNVSMVVAKTIDVSKNKKLTSLNVYNSKVSSLKFGKNKKLWCLNVSDNLKLKKLNVSGLNGLQEINIAGSGISKLNLNKNKKITTVGFTSSKVKSFKWLNSKIKDANLDLKVKKNKTIDMKKYIGSGWTTEMSTGKVTYKSGKVKVSGDGYIAFKKGNKHRYVSFSVVK